MITFPALNQQTLGNQIADAIREAIVRGELLVGERLPTEMEFADKFGVSRPTIREALKRLAAQNLIRSKRGPSGGTYVNQISRNEARDALVMTATLVVSMGTISLSDVVEARYIMEKACLALAVERRTAEHLDRLREEIRRQEYPGTPDEEFCASDVAFHRAIVDSACNEMVAFQMTGVIEAVQPVLNKIINNVRDRRQIVTAHRSLLQAIERQELAAAEDALVALTQYIREQTLRAQERRPQPFPVMIATG